MPLTEKGKKMKAAMEKKYGKEKGSKIFYATENKKRGNGIRKKR